MINKFLETKIKGKERENSYQELKKSQNDRHTQTHRNCIEIFRLARHPLVAPFVNSSDAVFVVCSQTFTLFRLRMTAVPVEISRYSFRVFVCACHFVISSIPGKSFLSLNLWFSYFGTFLSTWFFLETKIDII